MFTPISDDYWDYEFSDMDRKAEIAKPVEVQENKVKSNLTDISTLMSYRAGKIQQEERKKIEVS
jgi:hypothetical protein